MQMFKSSKFVLELFHEVLVFALARRHGFSRPFSSSKFPPILYGVEIMAYVG